MREREREREKNRDKLFLDSHPSFTPLSQFCWKYKPERLSMHVFMYFVGSLRVPMCFVVVAHEASAMPFGCFIWIWAGFLNVFV